MDGPKSPDSWPPAGRRPTATAPDETGGGTVTAVILIAFVGLLLVITSALGAAVTARHRAGAAADLAALAAAGAPVGVDACSTARRVAKANSGWLTGCHRLPDGSVVVSVVVSVAVGGPVTGTARAGASSGH